MEPSCQKAVEQGDLPFVQLPIIDLERLSGRKSEVSKTEEAQKLVDAFTDTGFCLLKNLEVFGYSQDEMKKAIHWFYHDVTSEDRLDQLGLKGFNSKNDNVARGLFPSEKDKLSCKEAYDIGEDFANFKTFDRKGNPFMGDTPRLSFPQDPDKQKEADQFYKVIFGHYKILKDAGFTMLSAISEAGGESSDYFHSAFGTPDEPSGSTFRTIMYPQRDIENVPKKAVLDDGKIISTPAHADSGVLTLLQTFGYPGLELMLDDKWYQVPPMNDCLVVNVGEYLTRMSNNRFKSTIHRVMDIGQDRFSNPFFFEPTLEADYNFKLPKQLLPTSEGQDESKGDLEYPYIPYGAPLLKKLTIYTEWANLYASLPEWMLEKFIRPDYGVSDWATVNNIVTDGAAGGGKPAQQ